MIARGFVLSVRRIALLGSLALALLWGWAPAPAGASPTQESMFQDDNLIVYGSPQVVTQTLARLKALGVDRIRVSVFWKLVALSLIWAYLHHFIAGLRHLWMDISHAAVSKEFGKSSAVFTLAVSIGLALVLGAKLFGLY